MDMKLEVVVVPVSDVDRARNFYKILGWRLDADFTGEDDFRVVQLTPPRSACSIIFGSGITSADPGSAEGLQLVVTNIDAARAELAGRGVDVSEVFHDTGGVFHHAGSAARAPGPAPNRKSYGSFFSLSDPDGNGWFVQEVTEVLPGRTWTCQSTMKAKIVAVACTTSRSLPRRHRVARWGSRYTRTAGAHHDKLRLTGPTSELALHARVRTALGRPMTVPG
jgi:catechol 2,3-dioxygenase-like lactoylglutathione lyase family enzyme